MKTYTVSWYTNYGLSVMVINASSKEGVEKIVEEEVAWDGYEIDELDTTSKGMVFLKTT